MKTFEHIFVWSMAAVLLVSIFTHSEPVIAGNSSNGITYSTTTPQFVLLSFDGSRSLEMWRETREFTEKISNQGKRLRFTYFINPIYLLSEDKKDLYESPRGNRGHSLIGFAKDENDVTLRALEIKKTFDAGNEIASHAVGHFPGGSFSEDEWKKEFISFQTLISDVKKNNQSVEIPDLAFLKNEIVGFRAPELSINNEMYKTLKEFNFLYDTSEIGSPDQMPTKDEFGIWHIPINTIEVGEENMPAIAMDYSLWRVQLSDGSEILKDSEKWNTYFRDVKNAYLEYFNRNYENKRAPVVIGHHFSLWNDGLYWEVMKSFAEEVCGKPEVYCVTYKEYVDYLNVKNSEPLVKKQ